jgi:GAF domain-containing protein
MAPDAAGLPPGLGAALRAGLELDPARRVPSAAAFARSIGASIADGRGAPLALSAAEVSRPRSLLEELVKATAGVFDAAAASIALADEAAGGLRYEAAWGAGAERVVGLRLPPGEGIAGAVALSGAPVAIDRCRTHPQFAADVAAGTGYVPHTMIAVPLRAGPRVLGVLAILDRRDGRPFDAADAARAEHLAVLAVAALEEREPGTVAGDGSAQDAPGWHCPPGSDTDSACQAPRTASPASAVGASPPSSASSCTEMSCTPATPASKSSPSTAG